MRDSKTRRAAQAKSGFDLKEAMIPTDSFSLIVIGGVALVAFWLVFSLVRKMFGLVLLVALAVGAWVLWSNPHLLYSVSGGLLGAP